MQNLVIPAVDQDIPIQPHKPGLGTKIFIPVNTVNCYISQKILSNLKGFKTENYYSTHI